VRRARPGAARAGAAERAAPHRLIRARARARRRARGRDVPEELGGAEAVRKRARRILARGVDPAEPGREPDRAAPARCTAWVIMQRRFVGRAEALVEAKAELTKMEGERARGGRRSDMTGERRRGA
jgi:hypothetical protein